MPVRGGERHGLEEVCACGGGGRHGVEGVCACGRVRGMGWRGVPMWGGWETWAGHVCACEWAGAERYGLGKWADLMGLHFHR